MNSVLEKDLIGLIYNKDIAWDSIDNSTFLITGATGLIGSLLIRTLLMYNQERNGNITIKALVRNRQRAENIFGNNESIEYLTTDIEDFEDTVMADYVIHCASPTKSKYFITKPVETIHSIVNGTDRLFSVLARSWTIKRIVYLSSMEMYGVLDSDCVTENDQGYIDVLNVRSSYSLGKRIAELYCRSYFEEYDLPVIIARLAMTFGAGIPAEDNRVCKYFCDCGARGKDIIIKSTGETVLNYVYTSDAVKGILMLLTNGNAGEAYNISGNNSGYTINDMAEYIASISDKNIKIVHEIPAAQTGFAPSNSMVLSNLKLKQLGWKPEYDVQDALSRTFEYIVEESKG